MTEENKYTQPARLMLEAGFDSGFIARMVERHIGELRNIVASPDKDVAIAENEALLAEIRSQMQE